MTVIGKLINNIKSVPGVVAVIEFGKDEGVNYQGVNCRMRHLIIYERMEAIPNPPDLGVHVQDGIKPVMKRG